MEFDFHLTPYLKIGSRYVMVLIAKSKYLNAYMKKTLRQERISWDIQVLILKERRLNQIC